MPGNVTTEEIIKKLPFPHLGIKKVLEDRYKGLTPDGKLAAERLVWEAYDAIGTILRGQILWNSLLDQPAAGLSGDLDEFLDRVRAQADKALSALPDVTILTAANRQIVLNYLDG